MASNETSKKEMTCRIRHPELYELIDLFQKSVERLETNLASDEFQCAVCLDSRSAFTQFYSVCELDRIIYKGPKDQLRSLFLRTIKLLTNEEYLDSVRNRYEDFENYLRGAETRSNSDTAVSIG